MIIDDLPSISIANDSDEIAIEQGTATKKITKGNFLQEVTSAISSLLSSLSGKVSKAGDTMSGALTVEMDSAGVYLESPNMPPSSGGGNAVGYRLLDKDGNNVAMYTDYYGSDGRQGVQITAGRIVNGSRKTNSLFLLLDASGDRSIAFSDSSVWRDAINAVNKSGDTMTGNLNYKNSNIDTNVPPSSATTWGNVYLKIQDKNGNDISRFRGVHYTDGRLGVQISSHNGNTENALRITSKADGTRDVNVTDSAAWRKALGLCYAANDTFAISSRMIFAGHVTNSTKDILFGVVTPKSMENISSVTVTALNGLIRGGSGYVENATSAQSWLSGYTVTATKNADNYVVVRIAKSTALANVDNNTPISAEVTITLKFT